MRAHVAQAARALAVLIAAAAIPGGVRARATEQPPGDAAAPFATPALADSSLGTITGREDLTQIAQSEQVAASSGNQVGANSRTGGVGVNGSAFQNASGFTMLNINSGNNVAINASMNVTISIAPQQP